MRPTYQTRFATPPGWRRIPPVTRALLVLVAAGYLLTLAWPVAAAWLVLAPGAVLAGQVWRLLTYAVVGASISGVLFSLLLVWSLGSEMEPRWGSRRFALFLVAAAAAAGVLGLFVGGGAGLAPVLLALIFAWMLEGPSQSLLFFGVFPMTRLAFAALALILVVFSELEATRSLLRLLFVLGGLPVAWLFARGFGGGRGGGPRFPRIRNPFRRRRFTVVDSGSDFRVH
ncbi:MAG TPA: rhomboid family intramembrane serine protease [Thermoanaerobaculia bacterium]|nr:rhomboid family intramembrane serine protease [Thermoanaerobaculia bacterium]